MPGLRRCSKCGCEKSTSCFYRNRSKKDGLSTHCRACVVAQSKRYYLANKEAINEKTKARVRQWTWKQRMHANSKRRDRGAKLHPEVIAQKHIRAVAEAHKNFQLARARCAQLHSEEVAAGLYGTEATTS